MLLRLKYYYLKFELLLRTVNTKLPRILRITKFGLLTTLVSLVAATSVVFAGECSNLRTWLGDQNCDAAEDNPNTMMPGTISTLSSIVAGHVEQEESGAYLIKGSLLVAANNMVVEVYEQTDQISGVKHIAETLENAGIVQPVQAAAPGYRTFEPIRNVWMVMRNIALAFVVITGLIMALMILLRVRQGQGYVTMLNALPKLVLTIVLIIFSYSFAGLLVDFGNTFEKLILSIFWNANFGGTSAFIDPTFRGGVSNVYESYPYNICNPVKNPEDWNKICEEPEDYSKDMNIFRLMSRFTEFETWGTVPCGDREPPEGMDECPVRVADIIRTPTGIGMLDRGIDVAERIPADQLLKLLITIVILTGILKVFIALVTAFAKMLIYTMFAPIVFLFYPFSGGTLTGWMRYFLASSLVFPVSFLMMFLAAIIMGDPHAPWFTVEKGTEVAGVAPDLLTYSTNRIAKDEGGEIVFLTRIVALVIVMMIPHLSKWLMEILKVPENLMLREAKAGFARVAAKVPIVGGMLSGVAA